MITAVERPQVRRRRWPLRCAVVFVLVFAWSSFQTSDVAFRLSRGSLEYALLTDDLGAGVRGVVLVVETSTDAGFTLFATNAFAFSKDGFLHSRSGKAPTDGRWPCQLRRLDDHWFAASCNYN